MMLKEVLTIGALVGGLGLAVGPAFANPAAVAAASSMAKSSASSKSTSTAKQGQLQGQGQGQGQGQSFENKGDDTTAVGVALGQAPTAAYGCLKGTRVLFGLLEWTDDSSKCENYANARIAEQAAAKAQTVEEANFYYVRANELRMKAEGLGDAE